MNPSFVPNLKHPANAGVIRYLKKRNEKAPPLQLPDSVSTPYYSLGSHPDIVERVWVQLADEPSPTGPQAERRRFRGRRS